MNKRTDLVLVSFLQDQPEGGTFLRGRHKGWPLHITLFPWFGVPDSEALDADLSRIAAKSRPFNAQIGSVKMFGSNGDIQVNIIQNQTRLKQLHQELSELTMSEVLESRWTGDGYNAHVTHHEGADNVREGDRIEVDHIYLVKMLDDDTCVFLKRYAFGDTNENKA